MELFDKLKLWYTCKVSGRMKEYETYKTQLEVKKSDINRFSKYLSDATQRFTNIQQIFPENSKEYIDAKDEMYRWKHSLDEAMLTLKFIRPNSQQDIEYRNEQCETFANKLQSVLSPNFDLRFHGTPIYFAEQIIKSGMISSVADRYDGYIKSTDMKGEISASDRQTIGRTINFFSDMTAYQRSLPSGCIFALFPKDKDDATYGPSLMHSVNLRQNPGQLFGVFTTPENIEQVKGWMSESKFNPDLVYTFEEFLQAVKIKSDKIEFYNRIERTQDNDNQIINPQRKNIDNIQQLDQGKKVIYQDNIENKTTGECIDNIATREDEQL